MEDKSLELLTDEGRKLYEEFKACQNMDEIYALMEKQNKLNEFRENNEIRHLNMTIEEFDAKYKLATLEDIQRKMGWNNQ